MKIKLTKYAHAYIVLALGVFIATCYHEWYTAFGSGLLMGFSLRLARQSGIETNKNKQ